MELVYSPEELDALINEYRFAPEPSADRNLSLPASDLLDGDLSRAYLEKVNDAVFEASSRMAAASLFAKRYSCLTIASSLYAMSVFDKGMDYAIENCSVESFYQGRAWLPKVRLTDRRATQPPGRGARDEWRDRVIRNVFADNLTKVWSALSKSVPISKAVLWENTAIYVFWLYENKFGEGLGESASCQVREDYEYLLRGAPGELFGEARNPLARFDSPKVTVEASEKPIRIRKTCCFYYQAADNPEDYCVTCPKLKREAIAER